MFISKKGPNLRRPTGIKINAKGDDGKQREIKTAEKDKKQQIKKDTEPEKQGEGK